MIRLRDLLPEYGAGHDTKEERTVWRTFYGQWGARNTIGQRRYFDTREDATRFARGELKGPHVGRPKRTLRAEPKEKVRRYDTREG